LESPSPEERKELVVSSSDRAGANGVVAIPLNGDQDRRIKLCSCDDAEPYIARKAGKPVPRALIEELCPDALQTDELADRRWRWCVNASKSEEFAFVHREPSKILTGNVQPISAEVLTKIPGDIRELHCLSECARCLCTTGAANSKEWGKGQAHRASDGVTVVQKLFVIFDAARAKIANETIDKIQCIDARETIVPIN